MTKRPKKAATVRFEEALIERIAAIAMVDYPDLYFAEVLRGLCRKGLIAYYAGDKDLPMQLPRTVPPMPRKSGSPSLIEEVLKPAARPKRRRR